ncbi:MAG TPA: DinB family protein [Vicinamibacterales bacterium]|nr:DinB family protein [Vicinamibacterales bacterium]
MTQDLTHTIALLARTPRALDALLRDLPDAWTQANEGGDTWTPFDIVGHLIDGERHDWIPRVRMILEFGETRTFEPFVRGGHVRETAGKTLPQLLDEFARTRAASLDQLRGFDLQPSDLERRGTHPSFGPVTLSQLIATWAGHDLTHLHQLSRTMACQYRDAVGPWTAYLGVMHCNAHSQ